uniref:Uncharacterized protein n=1 Tax=Oryza brachyantha TaxID=4533 RepID=J3M515_ORYBR
MPPCAVPRSATCAATSAAIPFTSLAAAPRLGSPERRRAMYHRRLLQAAGASPDRRPPAVASPDGCLPAATTEGNRSPSVSRRLSSHPRPEPAFPSPATLTVGLL